jgi:hypothetical protein
VQRISCAIFTCIEQFSRAYILFSASLSLRKAASDEVFDQTLNSGCTNSGHTAVDGLHLIENARVADAKFLLTLKTEGVET